MGALSDRAVDLLQRHRFALLWVGCAAVLATAWIRVFLLGALPYFLTDILISYAGGLSRRGLTGQIALWLSAALDGSAVFWALVLASAATVLLFALAIRLYRALPDDPAWLLLMLAPFGALFLAYDPNGAIRKEVFGYVSLLAVLQASLAARPAVARAWALIGAGGFLLSLLAHEALILLWPAMAAGFWLARRHWPELGRMALVLAAATGLGGVAVAGLTVLLPAPDTAAICAAARLDSCGGAIGWLNRDLAHAIATVAERRSARDLPIFGAYAALSLLPFLALRWHGRPFWAQLAAIAVPLLGVAPLFVIGFDWGRWLHMGVFPLSLVCVAAAILGEVGWRRQVPPLAIAVYVGSWSIPHAIATYNAAALAIWPALGLVHLFARWRRGRAASAA